MFIFDQESKITAMLILTKVAPSEQDTIITTLIMVNLHQSNNPALVQVATNKQPTMATII